MSIPEQALANQNSLLEIVQDSGVVKSVTSID